jgi:hypothetical protein
MGTTGYVRGLRVVSMMMSFICSCKNKKGKPNTMYFQEGKDHTRLFRGSITNDMKKQDSPSRSWPTPHTAPFLGLRSLVFHGNVNIRQALR